MCCVFIWLKKKCTQKFTPVIREHPVEKNIDEVDITILLLVQIGRYGLNCPPIDTVVIGCPLEDSQMMAEDFLKQESERAGRRVGAKAGVFPTKVVESTTHFWAPCTPR